MQWGRRIEKVTSCFVVEGHGRGKGGSSFLGMFLVLHLWAGLWGWQRNAAKSFLRLCAASSAVAMQSGGCSLCWRRPGSHVPGSESRVN